MKTPGGSQLTAGRRPYASASTKRKRSKLTFTRYLGRGLGAYVPPSTTTLAKSEGPFSNAKKVTFLYENALTKVTPGATYSVLSYVNNDMYDFDKSGSLGNKQPLYYDSLLSASGPYRAYKVISWRTTFTIINATACPINVWVASAMTGAAEIDSVTEADNFPGVKKLYLTEAGGSHQQDTITVTGHIDDTYSGFEKDLNLLGAYNSGPGGPSFGAFIVSAGDGASNITYYVAVKHEAFTELSQVDALVS